MYRAPIICGSTGAGSSGPCRQCWHAMRSPPRFAVGGQAPAHTSRPRPQADARQAGQGVSSQLGPLLRHLQRGYFQREVEGGDDGHRAIGPAVAMAGLPGVVAGHTEAARQEAHLRAAGHQQFTREAQGRGALGRGSRVAPPGSNATPAARPAEFPDSSGSGLLALPCNALLPPPVPRAPKQEPLGPPGPRRSSPGRCASPATRPPPWRSSWALRAG